MAEVDGVKLCTPPLWKGGLPAATAARIHGSGESGCKDLQALVAETGARCLVDVGAMFGACVAPVAKNFPEVRVVAYEAQASGLHLLRRTAQLNQLQIEARTMCLQQASQPCGCEACGTLEAEHPFDCEGGCRHFRAGAIEIVAAWD
ncbi:unnamed protein product [Symbiodinium sp. CCMP2592]|nr:unnamed protein product [Symbiodinium sp. CCMP2592]